MHWCCFNDFISFKYFDNFFKHHFYDLKMTFGYTGVIPEKFMSKYTQKV